MWMKYNVSPEEIGEGSVLMYGVSLLPKGVAILLIFGLLSAIVSSTDTCIINASSIFVKDLLGKENVALARIAVLVIGGIAFLLAFFGKSDIMQLLTGAYSVYTPGVIFPLAVAIFAYKKRELNKGIWLAAVIVGGLFGILGSNYSLIGMGCSLALSLLSVKRK